MSGTDIGPKISIEGEKQFKDSLKAINAEVKAHAAELKALAAQYADNDTSVDHLTQKQKILGDSLDASKSKIKTLTAEYERQKTKLSELKDKLEKTRLENGENSEAAIKAENAYQRQAAKVSNLSTQLSNAKTQLFNTEKGLKETTEQLEETTRKTETFNAELEDTAKQVEKNTDIFGRQTRIFKDVDGAMESTTQKTKNLGKSFEETLIGAGEHLENIGGKVEQFGDKVSSVGGKLTIGITTPLVALGVLAADSASDVEESTNKVEVAFGKSADGVKKFAESTVDNYGISKGAALDMAALYGDMGTAMQIPQDQAAEMSTALVGLAGDLASFKNVDLSTVQNALKGIFTGETESLKNLGIVMTETNLQSWATAKGLVSASNSAWNSLSQNEKVMLRYKYVIEQTKNAQGDYLRTSDGYANSQRTLQESTKELAATFGEVLLPEITPIVQKGTQIIKTVNSLDDNSKSLIVRTGAVAAAAGPVLKVAGTAITSIGKIAGGAGKLAKGLVAVAGPAGGAAAVLLGFGTAAYTAYKIIDNKRLDKLIADQFGDIVLSAQEVEDVAERLTTTEWTVKLDAVVEAKEKLAEFEKDIESGIEEIEKLNWKVSIGLELTEDEKNTYLSSVESFIKSGQEYISQQGYTISLAIDATLGGTSMGEGLSNFSSTFLTETLGEAEKLGTELADQINKSFSEGTFAEDRVKIEEMLSNYNAVLEKFRSYEAQAKQESFEFEVNTAFGSGVTKDSLDKVIGAAAENLSESYASALESLEITKVGIIQMADEMREAGIGEEFVNAVVTDFNNAAQSETWSKMGDGFNTSVGVALSGVADAFGDEIPSAQNEMTGYLDNFVDTLCNVTSEGGNTFGAAWADFGTNIEKPSREAQKAVKDSLDKIAPSKAEMESIRDQCLKAGLAVPESVKKGLEDVAALESVCGAGDGIYIQLAKTLADNPEKFAALRESENFGKGLDESLAKAIEMYTGYVVDAETGVWTKVEQTNQASSAEIAEMLNIYGAEAGESYADGLAEAYGLSYENGKWLIDKSAQGVKDNNNLTKAAEENADNAVKSADGVTSNAVLGAPQVEPVTIDVANPLHNAQAELDNNPLTVNVRAQVVNGAAAGLSIAQSVIPHATGGIITSPEISLMGEDGAEAIIPLSEKYRAEAHALLDDVSNIVAYRPHEYAANAAQSVGARRSQQQAKAAQQTFYQFAEGAIRSEVNTPATDPELISRTVLRNLTNAVQQKISSARGGAK